MVVSIVGSIRFCSPHQQQLSHYFATVVRYDFYDSLLLSDRNRMETLRADYVHLGTGHVPFSLT